MTKDIGAKLYFAQAPAPTKHEATSMYLFGAFSRLAMYAPIVINSSGKSSVDKDWKSESPIPIAHIKVKGNTAMNPKEFPKYFCMANKRSNETDTPIRQLKRCAIGMVSGSPSLFMTTKK
jgi:hypothetical protein